MKLPVVTVLSTMLLSIGVPAVCQGDPPPDAKMAPRSETSSAGKNVNATRMKIWIGGKSFPATFADNPAASAFKALLPASFDMTELNGNEKLFRLPSRLPSNDVNPGTIRAGDLMLWSSNTLVLFYQTFPTSYSYTRLAHIDNAEGLSAAVGKGGVTIRFELE